VNIERITSIEYECDEDCYDVEMEAPNHNFVTGEGIVVCNSHSVEYGLTSYVTAWLKHHYPAFYLKSLMNSKAKQEDVLPYIDECHRLSIEILPPDYSMGNRDWTVEGNAIRCGLCYIKGVGKNLTVKPTKSWSVLVAMNNKRVTENLIKAGALDYIGKSRGWMLSNLEDAQATLKRKAQCEDRIAINENALALATTDKERAKYTRQLNQWKAKLSEAEFTETAESKYDATAGEIEVLSFSFNALPKVLCGTAKRVTEFNDKNGHAMARIAFSTKYGEFEGVVFASAWKKAKYRDRYRGWCEGITVEQGKSYEFMMKKGIFVDVREIYEG
jgi:DNA polymerase-3 subunit alpha